MTVESIKSQEHIVVFQYRRLMLFKYYASRSRSRSLYKILYLPTATNSRHFHYLTLQMTVLLDAI